MKHKDTAGELQLSSNCRKALTVHLGEAAGREVAELLQKMADRIERLERSKVDIMPVISAEPAPPRRYAARPDCAHVAKCLGAGLGKPAPGLAPSGIHSRDDTMAKFLVTGAAGFIGFHLCQSLLTRGESVVGLDNLNDYYNVQLKRDRLSQLIERPGFQFHKIDLADRPALIGRCSRRAVSTSW